jgi:DNA modification methylase
MNKIEFGDCREIMKRWIDEGVKIQTCITSPPYYGLRDYGVDGQVGLEKSVDDYVNNMVEVFNHVKELLTDDGTLWLNLGDTYSDTRWSSGGGQIMNKNKDEHRSLQHEKNTGLPSKNLIGIPWKVAFALQADGWILRQDIIWQKPNPMPESVRDRCTKSHEYIFLLSKSPQYYFDHVAIKEPSVNPESYKGRRKRSSMTEQSEIIMDKFGATRSGFKNIEEGKTYPTRNKRDVWKVNVKPYKGAHFATYPTALIEPCILAGTSEKGHCPVCNARWKRMEIDTGERHDVEVYTGKAVKDYETAKVQNPSDTKRRVLESMSKIYKYEWIPTCECKLEPVPDIVFDPFMGSGTTAQVALQHGRQYLGCELNKEYEKLQQERINNGEGFSTKTI